MGNENEVKNLNEKEVNEVAGGADTSRDEIKKAIEDLVSKLPPRRKVKIFCYECRKSSDGWKPYGGLERYRCPKCGSAHVITKDTDEFETKNGKATQTPTAPETKN